MIGLVITDNIFQDKRPRLVAVSKTKPKEAIYEVYETGHRHFGENYIQELVDKGNDSEVFEIVLNFSISPVRDCPW